MHNKIVPDLERELVAYCSQIFYRISKLMNESFETPRESFIYPDIEKEKGEFERVATEFGFDTSNLIEQAQSGELIDLNDELWDILINTESRDVSKGDWNKVAELSDEKDPPRDWKDLKNKIESGIQLDGPIIIKIGDEYHVVSGDTRLLVSKALGIRPKVLLFEVEG